MLPKVIKNGKNFPVAKKCKSLVPNSKQDATEPSE